MRLEHGDLQDFDFGVPSIEELQHVEFRPVPRIREAMEETCGSIKIGEFRVINSYCIQDRPPNVFKLYDREFEVVQSRTAAVSGMGYHLILAAKEDIDSDPTPRQIAELLTSVVGSFDFGDIRVEINFGELRTRPHFHMHVIRPSNIGNGTLDAPFGYNIHYADEAILNLDRRIKIERLLIDPETSGTVFKASLGLLPHAADMVDSEIPGQLAPTARVVASKHKGSLVIAQIAGKELPRSVDRWSQ